VTINPIINQEPVIIRHGTPDVGGLFSVPSDYVIIYRLFVGWLVGTIHKEETVSFGVAECISVFRWMVKLLRNSERKF
jgi:hypothetical protein